MIPEMAELLRQRLRTIPEMAFAVLVGSRAKGTAHAEGDSDIALQWRPRPDWFAQLAAQETLRRDFANILQVQPEDIDSIDIACASLAMRANVAEEDRLLAGESGLAWAPFLTRTWRELEDHYWERGLTFTKPKQRATPTSNPRCPKPLDGFWSITI
jgi:hypothetical protein